MVEIVPATDAMLKKLYGHVFPKSCYAIAAVDGDKVLGIGGFYLEKIAAVMFAEVSDELKASPRTIVRAYRKLFEMAREKGVKVYARCDRNIEAAERFLAHLGFEHVEGDIYGMMP